MIGWGVGGHCPGEGKTMARMTKAQKIEAENEAQALQLFQDGLAALPDPRRPQGLRYPLQTVVTIALMASVCGSDDAEAMQAWGEAHEEWLAGFLPMPHGAPTQDVFLAVFGALYPEAFSKVFRAWAELLALRLKATGKHIAVDRRKDPQALVDRKPAPLGAGPLPFERTRPATGPRTPPRT